MGPSYVGRLLPGPCELGGAGARSLEAYSCLEDFRFFEPGKRITR